MKVKQVTKQIFTNENDIECNLTHKPCDWRSRDAITTTLPNGWIVIGYLVHDDSPQNPFEDCDDMDHIIWHPRSKYRNPKGAPDFYEALGLDSDGEPDLDHMSVEKTVDTEYGIWVSKITDEMIVAAFVDSVEDIAPEDCNEFRQYLIDMCYTPEWSIGDYFYRAADAFKLEEGFDGLHGWRDIEAAIDASGIEYPKLPDRLAVWRSLRGAELLGNKHARKLDCYEHSGVALSLSGQGMQCRWDTSRGMAMWLPNEEYLPETDEDALARAKSTIELWNNWANGNCYGYTVDLFKPEGGEPVESESCWGYFGDDGVDELKSQHEWFVNNIEKYSGDSHS